MNHLLHQLESGGYLVREAHPDDRRTRVVRLTDRGWAAVGVIRQAMVRLERDWARALGRETYGCLASALVQLEAVLDEAVGTGR